MFSYDTVSLGSGAYVLEIFPKEGLTTGQNQLDSVPGSPLDDCKDEEWALDEKGICEYLMMVISFQLRNW